MGSSGVPPYPPEGACRETRARLTFVVIERGVGGTRYDGTLGSLRGPTQMVRSPGLRYSPQGRPAPDDDGVRRRYLLSSTDPGQADKGRVGWIRTRDVSRARPSRMGTDAESERPPGHCTGPWDVVCGPRGLGRAGRDRTHPASAASTRRIAVRRRGAAPTPRGGEYRVARPARSARPRPGRVGSAVSRARRAYNELRRRVGETGPEAEPEEHARRAAPAPRTGRRARARPEMEATHLASRTAGSWGGGSPSQNFP